MIEINGKKRCPCCFKEITAEPCRKCGYDGDRMELFPVLPIGTRLNGGRILIGGVIGRGGFGITYAAFDIQRDELIAVKEYYPSVYAYRSVGQTQITVNTGHEEYENAFHTGVERFFAEADVVRQFNGNPNIVSVYDVFKENGTVYLTMEYLKGLTLLECVRQDGRLTAGQTITMATAVASALQIIHSREIVHKDISPDNIMLCLPTVTEKQGKIKILDFGAARESNHSQSIVIAKTGYTPVEQLAGGGKPTGAADIYALGATMYYALKGEVPVSSQERLKNDVNKKFMSSDHGIDPKLWKIIKKATMLRASDRYKNAEAMLADLKKLQYMAEPIVVTEESIDDDPALMIPAEKREEGDGTYLLSKSEWLRERPLHLSHIEEYDRKIEKSKKNYRIIGAVGGTAAVIAVAAAIIVPIITGGDVPSVSDEGTETAVISETVTEAAPPETTVTTAPPETTAETTSKIEKIPGVGAVFIENERAKNSTNPFDTHILRTAGENAVYDTAMSTLCAPREDCCDLFLWLVDGEVTDRDKVYSQLSDKYDSFTDRRGFAVAQYDFRDGSDLNTEYIIISKGCVITEERLSEISDNTRTSQMSTGLLDINNIIEELNNEIFGE